MMDRPETLPSTTTAIPTGYGKLYITITECDEKPFEVFATIGKSGKSIAAKSEVIGRLISLALRNNIPIEEIIKQLVGISGESPTPYKDTIILSIPDAIGKVLKEKYIKKIEKKDG